MSDLPDDFRLATERDAPALLRLMRAYYAEDGYPLHERDAARALRELLADPRLGRIWIAERNDSAVAYAVLTFGYSLEYLGRDAWVDELFVAGNFRAMGLGRRALELMAETCDAEGVRVLHLEVERDKSQAIELYRRAGFVDHDRHLMTMAIGADDKRETR